jgi:hypothetical protein
VTVCVGLACAERARLCGRSASRLPSAAAPCCELLLALERGAESGLSSRFARTFAAEEAEAAEAEDEAAEEEEED